MDELRSLEERKRKLTELIEFTQKKKKETLEIAQELSSKFNSGRISKYEYEEKLESALKHRSVKSWIKYCDDLLRYYRYQLELCEGLINKEKNNLRQKARIIPSEKTTIYGGWENKSKRNFIPVLIILIVLVLIALIISTFFIFKSAQTDVFKIIREKISGVDLKFGTEKQAQEIESPLGPETILPVVPVILDDEGATLQEESLIQYQAIVGRPVVWKKKFSVQGVSGFSVELPGGSKDIIVKSNGQEITNLVKVNKKRNLFFFGEKSVEVSINTGGITGNAINENAEGQQTIEVIYETEAPQIEVTNENENVRIKVIGPDYIHYQNVLSFAEINEGLSLEEKNKLKLYEIKNGERVPTKFIAYDTNENGLIDSIEFITPGLSIAEFLLVIEISKAELFDENKIFVEDIYQQVKSKDNNWKLIPDNYSVRTTFEQKLDSSKDITLYARGKGIVEVYEAEDTNENNLLIKFEIEGEKEYKDLLNKLSESQDTFYLKFFGNIEVDWIVDPTLISLIFGETGLGLDYLTGSNWVFVNVTANTTSGNVSTFIDFDRSLVGWWRMDDANPELAIDSGLDECNGYWTTEGIYCYENCGDIGCYWDNVEDYGYITQTIEGLEAGGIYDYNITVGSYSDLEDSLYVTILWGEDDVDSFYLNTGPAPFNIIGSVTATGSTGDFSINIQNYNNGGSEYSINFDSISFKKRNRNISDYTGRNNGTPVGNVVQTDAGKLGKAFSFDGDGDYIDLGQNTLSSDLNGSSQITLSAWFNNKKSTASNSEQYILVGYIGSGKAGINLALQDIGGVDYIRVAGRSVSGDGLNKIVYPFSKINEWHHLAGTIDYSNNRIKLYLDGILVNESSSNFLNPVYTAGVVGTGSDRIGSAVPPGDVSFFNGSIDDVMIFNRSLSSAEIAGLYANSSSKFLFNNFTNLIGKNYTFKAYVQDAAGNVNSTEIREIKILSVTLPEINFTNPTLPNGTITFATSLPINVSARSNDSLNNISTFIDLDRTLVGWWKLDEASGNIAYDYSGYGNNATIYGANYNASGKLGGSYMFNGSTATYLKPSVSSIQGLTDFTFSIWFKSTSLQDRYFFSGALGPYSPERYDDQITMGFSGGRPLIRVDSNYTNMPYAFNSPFAYNDYNWHQLVVTLDYNNFSSNNLSCYVDNFYLGSQIIKSRPIIFAEGGFIIGQEQDNVGGGFNPAQAWNGSLDDAMIFRRALSSQEISALYANASSRYLFNNFTDLPKGDHTFKAYMQDNFGNVNSTELREVSIGTESIDSCGELNKSNIVYKLNKSVTTTGTCFNITADNITLDGNGFVITGTGKIGFGVYANGIKNITIKNFRNITDFARGIYFVSTNNSFIQNLSSVLNINGISLNSSSNNTFSSINANSNTRGLDLVNSSNNTFSSINANSNTNYGIVLAYSSTNTLSNINVNLTSGDGVRLEYSLNNNLSLLNVNSNSQHGIVLAYSSTNTLSSINANSNPQYGIVLASSSNNTLLSINAKLNGREGVRLESSSNNILINSNLSGNINNDTRLVYASRNNTFLNVTYNSSKESVVDDHSQLIRKWYYQANVTNNNYPFIAELSVHNKSYPAGWQFNQTPASNGFTLRTEIIDYISNGTRNYYSNYTIDAFTSMGRTTHILNVTQRANQIGFGGLIMHNVELNQIAVSECRVINKSGNYFMNRSIINNTLTTPCINITVSNVTLDCNGYYIKSDDNYAGIYSNNLSTIIKNCNITMGPSGIGIYLDNANYSYLFNNFVYGSGIVFQGIYLKSSYSNIVNTTSISSYSSLLLQGSNNQILDFISTSISVGIYISDSENNSLRNINSSGGSTGISFQFDSKNNLVQDSKISTGAGGQDVASFSTSVNNVLLNCSYDTFKELVNSGNNVIRKWYYQANITNNGNPVDGANLSAYNNSYPAGGQFNLTSDSLGLTNVTTITDYVTSGTRRYYSPYTINVKSETLEKVQMLNVTNKSLASEFNGLILDNIDLGTPGNNAPRIIWVEKLANQDPNGGGVKNVSFKFTAQDYDGEANLNDSSAQANFSLVGYEKSRNNLSCSRIIGESSGNYANYSCTIGMLYYDDSGDWNMTVSIKDKNGNLGINNSQTFVYNLLQQVSGLSLLDWEILSPGDTNRQPKTLFIANNTGNYDIPSIQINATNLFNDTYFIEVSNFSVNSSDGGGKGDLLVNNAFITIFNSSLASYNSTSTGERPLYFYIQKVPSVPSLDYQTLIPWDITFSLVVFSARRKKKNKKQDGLKYEKNLVTQENLLEIFEEKLKTKYGIEIKELFKENKNNKLVKEEKEILIPVEIFKKNDGAAEVLCKYLKENKGLKLREIAHILNRDERTIGINYKNSIKNKKNILVSEDSALIPVSAFANRELSILESVVKYFKDRKYKNVEIAKILNKDQRNIYTLYSRACRKLKLMNLD